MAVLLLLAATFLLSCIDAQSVRGKCREHLWGALGVMGVEVQKGGVKEVRGEGGGSKSWRV